MQSDNTEARTFLLRRDFANGFLYAEILSRYYPADVQMHSFENVASMERKKKNWSLLEKVIKVGAGGPCEGRRSARQYSPEKSAGGALRGEAGLALGARAHDEPDQRPSNTGQHALLNATPPAARKTEPMPVGGSTNMALTRVPVRGSCTLPRVRSRTAPPLM